MTPNPRPIAFILASTDHGAMILNKNDFNVKEGGHAYGVAAQLLFSSSYDPGDMALTTLLLDLRRQHFGDDVTALDIGANIGVFTIGWAKHMHTWGAVLAIEAQERIFLALAGNIALNNCFNARPICAAVTRQPGTMAVPVPNYLIPGSYGSLELRRRENTEDIGQPIDYSEAKMMTIAAVSVDGLQLGRVDLMKIDVEGMEMEVLEGARRTIGQNHPILVVEAHKIERAALKRYLDEFGYRDFSVGINVVAIHPSDPSIHTMRERLLGLR
jgi:FkbM family methyltransferase